MRPALAILCLLGAVAFPLILDGQTFRNSILGMVFAGAALLLAMRQQTRAKHPFSSKLIAIVSPVVLGFLLAQLPHAYRFQTAFNQKLEDARARAAVQADGQTNESPAGDPVSR